MSLNHMPGNTPGQPVTQPRITYIVMSSHSYQYTDVYISQRSGAHMLLALVNNFFTANFLGDQITQLLFKLLLVRGIFLDLSKSHKDLKLLTSEVIIEMGCRLFSWR